MADGLDGAAHLLEVDGRLSDDARHARAVELLEAGSGTLAQITDRLGYSDASSFSRASHCWESTTPRRFTRDPARSASPGRPAVGPEGGAGRYES